MKNIENLEKYIREEIDKIEIGGADDMWNDFKPQLEGEELPKDTSKGNLFSYKNLFFMSLGFIVTMLGIGTIYLNSNNINKENKRLGSKENQKENLVIKDFNEENEKEVFKVNTEKSNHNVEANKNGFDEEGLETLNEIKSWTNEGTTESIQMETKKFDLYKTKLESKNPQKNSTSKEIHKDDTIIKSSNSNQTDPPHINDYKSTNRILQEPNNTATNIQSSSESDNVIPKTFNIHNQDENNTKIFDLQSGEKEINTQKLLLNKIKPLNLTNASMRGQSINQKLIPNPDPIKNRSTFISIQTSYAKKNLKLREGRERLYGNIENYSIAYGKQFSLKSNFKFNVQLGARYDRGYDLTQDSVFIIQGISLIEHTKYKSLKGLWQGLVKLEMMRSYKKLEIGVGSTLTYAVANKFRYYETAYSVNNVFEIDPADKLKRDVYHQNGTWTGINRFGVEGYLHAEYRLNYKYTFGVLLSQRFNPVIKKDNAQKVFPWSNNRQAHFGIYIKYNL